MACLLGKKKHGTRYLKGFRVREDAGIQYMSLSFVMLCDYCTEWLNEGILQDIADLKKSVGSPGCHPTGPEGEA